MIEETISSVRPTHFFVCFVLIWFSSCTTNVKKGELVGHWEMAADAVQRLGIPKDFNKRPELTLRADDTFTAKNMPGKIIYRFKDQTSVFSGNGRWWIPKSAWSQGFSSLILQFSNVGGGDKAQPTLKIDKTGKDITVFAWDEEEGGERLEFHKLQ